MGCVQSREIGTGELLAFQGLSCWEASVTLYFALKGLLTVAVETILAWG